jgi:hypothetical protein
MQERVMRKVALMATAASLQNARMQAGPKVVVVPDAMAAGSIRQRTCSVDVYGNQACTEVVR